jgi:hypothetical protein
MANLLAEDNGVTQDKIPPLRYKLTVQIRLQIYKNRSNNVTGVVRFPTPK